MLTKIKNGRLVLPDKVLENQNLYFADNVIQYITSENIPCDAEIDAAGNYVSPGFIDTHIHGGDGFDFSEEKIPEILKGIDLHLKHGTTTILPSLSACSTETMLEFLENIKTIMEENLSSCRVFGVHLEGPYFSPAQCGAQNPGLIRNPQKDEYLKIIKEYGSMVKRWSFAPELDGAEAFCKTLLENHITPSIAHSDAEYSDVLRVYELGLRMVTHLYSGMSTITRVGGFRHLGIIEATYLLEGMHAEIIADGCHLPPELLRLIVKNLGVDNLCLVTDAIRAAGTKETYYYEGEPCEENIRYIEDDIAKMPDRTCFAGSIATTDRIVRTMVKKAGCSVCDAVKMMTKNPAKSIGAENLGELREGNLADIVIFDDDIVIKHVIANGKTIL